MALSYVRQRDILEDRFMALSYICKTKQYV